ncbi:hypothetical protein GCM10027592_20490 [Spirosoma flavus]
MNSLHPSYPEPAAPKSTPGQSSLALYDRYGSLVYGIICKIIPEPELAQTVLFELFISPEVKSLTENSGLVSATLIRLARAKALALRPVRPSVSVSPSATDDLGVLVFELSFYQGYSVEQVADKLQLTPATVLQLIAQQFKHQRSSK